MFGSVTFDFLPFTLMYGLPCAVVMLLFWLVFFKWSKPVFWREADTPSPWIDVLSLTSLWFAIGLSLAYFFHPSYLDHLEATAALLGRVLREGAPVWPDLQTDHSYRGLLYGPALSELQYIASWLPLDPILASKVPGVLAFVTALLWLMRLATSTVARVYLTLLLPFGSLLFWTRAEPVFLWLVTATLAMSISTQARAWPAVAIGAFAGLACAFKLHAAIYVLCAWLCMSSTISLFSLILFGLSTAAVLAASFLPSGTDWHGFSSYVTLASHHGLRLETGAKNLLHAAFIVSPVASIAWSLRQDRAWLLRGMVFTGTALLMVLIGAKPGAGQHHLIPLVPIGAMLLHRAQQTGKKTAWGIRATLLSAFCFATPGLVTLVQIGATMLNEHASLSKARTDLEMISSRHQGAVMGLPDRQGYQLTNLRPLMPTAASAQIDYASYMDLEFAGIDANELQQALASCKIKAIVMPRTDHPFSMLSFYTFKPLFSALVARTFNAKYKVVDRSEFFDLYACQPPSIGSSHPQY